MVPGSDGAGRPVDARTAGATAKHRLRVPRIDADDHRHCDAIEIANCSNLADSFCSGVIQTNNHALYKTPTYYVQELYANHAGQTPLTVGIDADLPADPAVDTSATLSADGTVLSVFAVNHTGTAQRRTLDLAALAPKKNIAWYDHQCSYADLIVDGENLHLFLPHRWERVLHLRLKASDIPNLPVGQLPSNYGSSKPAR